MIARYEVETCDLGYFAVDLQTGAPAQVNGVAQTGLKFEDADVLADLLDRLETQRQIAKKQ